MYTSVSTLAGPDAAPSSPGGRNREGSVTRRLAMETRARSAGPVSEAVAC